MGICAVVSTDEQMMGEHPPNEPPRLP